jgi:hypothetical protein
MKRMTYNTASRRHTFITVLGFTVLTFLILVSIASATQDSDAWVSKGIAFDNLNKYNEAITAYDKAISWLFKCTHISSSLQLSIIFFLNDQTRVMPGM